MIRFDRDRAEILVSVLQALEVSGIHSSRDLIQRLSDAGVPGYTRELVNFTVEDDLIRDLRHCIHNQMEENFDDERLVDFIAGVIQRPDAVNVIGKDALETLRKALLNPKELRNLERLSTENRSCAKCGISIKVLGQAVTAHGNTIFCQKCMPFSYTNCASSGCGSVAEIPKKIRTLLLKLKCPSCLMKEEIKQEIEQNRDQVRDQVVDGQEIHQTQAVQEHYFDMPEMPRDIENNFGLRRPTYVAIPAGGWYRPDPPLPIDPLTNPHLRPLPPLTPDENLENFAERGRLHTQRARRVIGGDEGLDQ